MDKTETQEAPFVLELLDRLVEHYDSKAALIRDLDVPRSSFFHWLTGDRDPHPEGLTKIHRLAVHHGLIAPDAPLPRPESQSEPDWEPEQEAKPEPISRGMKIGLGIFAVGILGLVVYASRA